MARATQRATLTARVLPRLILGLEWNPRADEVGPLANVVAVTETRRRPAVILGTSSDRIGTRSGNSYYVTVSKDLAAEGRPPIAPYAGVAYGTHEDKARAIAGLQLGFSDRYSSTFLFDGVHLHLGFGISLPGGHELLLLLVEGEDPGIGYSIRF